MVVKAQILDCWNIEGHNPDKSNLQPHQSTDLKELEDLWWAFQTCRSLSQIQIFPRPYQLAKTLAASSLCRFLTMVYF